MRAKSFAMGVQLGRRLKNTRLGPAPAYLYNGLKFPPLPQVEGFGYALLFYYEEKTSGPARAELYLLSAPCYYKGALNYYRMTGSCMCYSWYGDERWLDAGWTDLGHPENIVLNEWMHIGTKSGEDFTVFTFQTPFWLNFDILKTDGTVKTAAGAVAIPVYE